MRKKPFLIIVSVFIFTLLTLAAKHMDASPLKTEILLDNTLFSTTQDTPAQPAEMKAVIDLR